MCMCWTVCLLVMFLSGCQSMPLLERPTEGVQLSAMSLWEHYQSCLTSTDPTTLELIIEQFELAAQPEVEPPAWMKIWGQHVVSQPVRTVIDPQALAASCTLRAAAVMVEAEQPVKAQTLYRHVLARYSSRDWSYYIDQAKEGLARLQSSGSAVMAFRPNSALSR
jgi:hypothetical protein